MLTIGPCTKPAKLKTIPVTFFDTLRIYVGATTTTRSRNDVSSTRFRIPSQVRFRSPFHDGPGRPAVSFVPAGAITFRRRVAEQKRRKFVDAKKHLAARRNERRNWKRKALHTRLHPLYRRRPCTGPPCPRKRFNRNTEDRSDWRNREQIGDANNGRARDLFRVRNPTVRTAFSGPVVVPCLYVSRRGRGTLRATVFEFSRYVVLE